jgi:hypothetical protein
MDNMNSTNTNGTPPLKEPETPKIIKRIAGTTYKVFISFSKTSTESMADKIKRLIQNDAWH